MKQSRLARSYEARLRNLKDIRTFCDAEGIPYVLDFHDKTQPTDEIREQFGNAFSMDTFPHTELAEKGASTVIVFEMKEDERNHGEMVAAVADTVGRNLEAGVETIYVNAALNSNFRKFKQPKMVEPVSRLIANQGVPVVQTSIGWNDIALSFGGGLEEQTEELWKVTAFVVNSAGNNGGHGDDGRLPFVRQKHNAVSHMPPLVVNVGAAAKGTDGQWHVEGYSSANSPTLLAPVAADTYASWDKTKEPGKLIGTSLAAPYTSGVLAALNRRYGPYLTREQILYAVMATAKKVDDVIPFQPKTKSRADLVYTQNAAGLSYNPLYAGFGLIQPYAADKLLGHMVHLTQQNPKSLTVPIEERVKVEVPKGHLPKRNAAGKYGYEIQMPSGIALKTTLAIEFSEAEGDVELVSPSGTRLPMNMSKLPVEGKYFGLSTSHGWAGEELGGMWRIESTAPIKQMQMSQHHFLSNDIVSQLNVEKLLETPVPSLAGAQRLTEITKDQLHWRGVRSVELSGMTIGGKSSDLENKQEMLSQLQALPSAFEKRNRIYSNLPEIPYGSAGYVEEQEAYKPHPPDWTTLEKKAGHFMRAASLYKDEGYVARQALMLSMAATQLLYIRPPNSGIYLPREDGTIAPEVAATMLEQSIAIRKAIGQTDLAYYDCGQLYKARAHMALHYRALGDNNRANENEAAMRSLRKEARLLWNEYFGGADPRAHRIEEGEMGFSDNEPIGTDNIVPCMTVLAHDPVTLKTGLVHIDYHADVGTLKKFFDSFSDNRLQVRLVGAHLANNPHSISNINKVMDYLANKNIDIISADILKGPSGPAALVVDPRTFKVTENVPTKSTTNEGVANVALYFSQQSKPLDKQFDLTQSEKHSPIFLSGKVLDRIRKKYQLMSEAETEEYFASLNFVDLPLVVDHLQGLLQAYSKEWNAMSDMLEQTLVEQGADAENAYRARQALLKQRFFVGENAREANSAIYTWIKSALLKDGMVQHAAAQGVRLDNEPHRLSFVKALNQQSSGASPLGLY